MDHCREAPGGRSAVEDLGAMLEVRPAVQLLTPPPQIPFYDQPAASVLGTSPEASIEIQIPEPGPQSEGVTSQRIHIRSCFLEDTTVGNSNRMMVHPGAADVKGVQRPRETGGDAGEPGAGRGPHALSLIHSTVLNLPFPGVGEAGESWQKWRTPNPSLSWEPLLPHLSVEG